MCDADSKYLLNSILYIKCIAHFINLSIVIHTVWSLYSFYIPVTSFDDVAGKSPGAMKTPPGQAKDNLHSSSLSSETPCNITCDNWFTILPLANALLEQGILWTMRKKLHVLEEMTELHKERAVSTTLFHPIFLFSVLRSWERQDSPSPVNQAS